MATLFWVVVPAALAIWAAVIGLAFYASHVRPGRHSVRAASRLILWGGIVLPTITVFAMLLAGLFILRGIGGEAGELRVSAQGERWWWRIAQTGPDGEQIPTPNELRLPVGRAAEIDLTANEVIHSFWLPNLGGKMDMIPGRKNRRVLVPGRTGTFRGQCAEFCGGAHAMMAFYAVVMAPADYAAWLAHQAESAKEPETPEAQEGLKLFLTAGCGACHTVRGTRAAGRVGPDLTHVGSRVSLGAGLLPMSEEAMRDWIAHAPEIKPGVNMPSFAFLPEDEIARIAAYLVGLK